MRKPQYFVYFYDAISFAQDKVLLRTLKVDAISKRFASPT